MDETVSALQIAESHLQENWISQGSPMHVREISASELKDLLALYQYLHTDVDSVPDWDTVESIWQELRVSPYHKYFGVYLEGRLLSSCTLTLTPTLTHGCRPYGVIENVVTDVGWRHRGLATAVLEKALAFSWAHNCYQVMLTTGRKDESTHRLYESVGFDRHEKLAFIARPPSRDASR